MEEKYMIILFQSMDNDSNLVILPLGFEKNLLIRTKSPCSAPTAKDISWILRGVEATSSSATMVEAAQPRLARQCVDALAFLGLSLATTSLTGGGRRWQEGRHITG